MSLPEFALANYRVILLGRPVVASATRAMTIKGEMKNFPKVFFLALLKFYKILVSPFLPKACRFIPTCSEYSAEAIKKHGAFKGGILTIKRLCRCHPWGKSGYDPIP